MYGKRKLLDVHFMAHSAPYFLQSGILNVNDLYQQQLCLLAYKVFYNAALPVCITLSYKKISHSHCTRVVDYNFCFLYSKTNVRRYSCIVNSISCWNNLSVSIRKCNYLSICLRSVLGVTSFNYMFNLKLKLLLFAICTCLSI